MIYLIYILLGLIVGAISAILGLGGGILIVPLLPWVTDLSQKEVIATSLLTIFFVVSVNTLSFHKKNLVRWKVALFMGPLASVCSFLAGYYSQGLNDQTLKIIFAFVIFGFTLRILTQKKKLSVSEEKPPHPIFSGLLGVFGGAITGLSGVGAGVVLSPTLLHFKLVKNEEVSPTANAIMIFTTFFGAIPYMSSHQFSTSWDNYQLGYAHIDIALILVVSALFVAHWARKMQHKVSFQKRKMILSLMLIVLTIKTILSAI